MAQDLNKLVKRIVNRNRWLSGWIDYAEGDPTGLIEAKYFYKVSIVNDIDELYNLLLGWDGTFKYKNLLFFKHWKYGTFVYDIRKPDTYIEHLDIEAITKEKFKTLVQELL